MTVVAIRRYSEHFEIASDSCFVDRLCVATDQSAKDRRKFFHCQSAAEGLSSFWVAGSGSIGETHLMAEFATKHSPESQTVVGVVRFMAEFRAWLKELLGIEREAESENQYLLVCDENVFHVYNEATVVEVSEFGAIGCGAGFAKAAMLAGANPRQACEIAIKLSDGCGGPVVSASIPLESGRSLN